MSRKAIGVLLAMLPWTVVAWPVAPADSGEVATAVAAVNRHIDQLLGDHAQYEPVIRAFQRAVAAKDAAAVAALVAYPLRVRLAGKPATIRDTREFVAHYAAIVTPPMAVAIARQPYGKLFVNYQGVMFGDGEAWIDGICRDKACKHFDVKVVALQPGP